MADLRRLGVTPGDVLFVHSSYKSLGPVEGGAATVIGALEEALGPAGTLLMPTFSLWEREQDARCRTWEITTTKSSVGYLSEFCRGLPGSLRSDHYSHAVVARGAEAAAFVLEHRERADRHSPWDRAPYGTTYSDRSPMLKIYAHPRGRVLMLGVDYHSSTFCHVVEALFWAQRRAANPQADYTWITREWVGHWWDGLGRLARGRVAQADCRLFGARDYVDRLLAAITAEPRRFAKWFTT